MGLPSDIGSRYENHLSTRHPIGFCFGAIPAVGFRIQKKEELIFVGC